MSRADQLVGMLVVPGIGKTHLGYAARLRFSENCISTDRPRLPGSILLLIFYNARLCSFETA